MVEPPLSRITIITAARALANLGDINMCMAASHLR
jgi:hypothetical protein